MEDNESIFQMIRLNDHASLQAISGKYTPDITNEDGQSLMHEAASFNSVECASELLKNSCPINMQDPKGMTPLHYAVANSSYNVAKLLLESGVDASLVDKYGNEPLWTATFNARGEYEIVKLFANSNSSPDHKNNNGKSPLDFANQIKDGYLIDILNTIK